MNLPPLINVNSHKFVVIIPAAGISERFTNGVTFASSYNRASPTPTTSSSSRASSPSITNAATNVGWTNKRRISLAEPKQYQTICERPLIFHTVSAFLKHKWIDHIIVVAPSDSLTKMEQILSPLVRGQQKRFDCIIGSTTRHRSIREAIQFLLHRTTTTTTATTKSKNTGTTGTTTTITPPDIVIVHDGARPFVDADTLHQLVSNAYEFGSAGVMTKLTSTIVSAGEVNAQLWRLGSALNRANHWASEMPQAFRYNLICDAYNKITEHELDHNTECLDLIQRHTKCDARLIQIDPNLYFKVTYRKDLYAADGILKERRNILLHCDFIEKQMSVNYKFIKQLKDDLCASFTAVNYFNNSNITDKYQSNAAIHSTGIVHVLLHYCHHWCDVLAEGNDDNLINYDNLVYIVVISPNAKKKLKKISNNDDECCLTTTTTTTTALMNNIGGDNSDDQKLDDSAYPLLIQWTKRKVQTKEIKNFYLILIHGDNLDQESQRVRNTAVYLCKELPSQLSGQCFFI